MRFAVPPLVSKMLASRFARGLVQVPPALTGGAGRTALARSAVKVLSLVGALVAALAVSATPARAGVLSPDIQAILLLRVLAYDRAVVRLPARKITIAVVFRAGDSGSEAEGRAVASSLEALSGKVNVGNKQIEVVSIPFTNRSAFERRIETLRPVAMYFGTSVEAAAGDLRAISRKLSVLTFTGAADSSSSTAASIALVARGDKAKIVVNLKAAKAEGADLDAGLLRLAEIVE